MSKYIFFIESRGYNMEKSTLILILVLIGILLFATHIQQYTGQMVKVWFERREYCLDSDGGFSPFIYGKVEYPFQTRMYTYIDTCDGSKMYEGICDNGELLKVPFQCPNGCSGHGADNHGACICVKDRECPLGYVCHREGYCYTFAK